MCLGLIRAGRAVIRAKGPDAMSLLHSLITNDIHHLSDAPNCIYSMLLNPRGRILFDAIVYSTQEPETVYVDCDRTHLSAFQKHLNMYKLKKNVRIEPTDQNVWVLFNSSSNHESNLDKDLIELAQRANPAVYIDPRLNTLGLRLLFPKDTSPNVIIKELNVSNVNTAVDPEDYRNFRYRLGVSEGARDINPGNGFPLEANCDYLHGVSFHKGCYIGQELTARTHHTGVVRKRIMPLVFDREVGADIPNDTPIYSSEDPNKAIGKLRGVSKNAGIGLLRISEALAAPSLKLLDFDVKTFRPKWWPVEAPKEKPN